MNNEELKPCPICGGEANWEELCKKFKVFLEKVAHTKLYEEDAYGSLFSHYRDSDLPKEACILLLEYEEKGKILRKDFYEACKRQGKGIEGV